MPANLEAASKPNLETAPYFEGLAAGKLMLKRCKACGEAHFYPRARCPFCLGETAWEASAGEGTIYSFSVVKRGENAHVLAYVTLAEGPTIMTAIVDSDPATLRIDDPVSLHISPDRQGRLAPMFTAA